jgi:hypothetical protein
VSAERTHQLNNAVVRSRVRWDVIHEDNGTHIRDRTQDRCVAGIDDQEMGPVRRGELLRDRDRRRVEDVEIDPVAQALPDVTPNVCVRGHDQHRMPLLPIADVRRRHRGGLITR